MSFLRERDIHRIHSSVYYPQANSAVEWFNHVWKHCIQSDVAMQPPWKPAVTAFLHNFHATPHATLQPLVPPLLNSSFWMCNKLNVLHVSSETKSHEQVKEIITQKQLKSKVYTDKRRGVKVPNFKENNKVCVKKPIQMQKRNITVFKPALCKGKSWSKQIPTEWWKEVECLAPHLLPKRGTDKSRRNTQWD